MNVWNGIGAYPEDAPPAVATIGNYDGVHLGHQAILRRVVEDARAQGLPSLLISFSPHPLSVLVPERKPRLLQTRGQKLECLRQTGLTDLLLLEFNVEIAALTGEEFFGQLLNGRVSFSAIHVGENFRFGNKRRGDLDLLHHIGADRGFAVDGLLPVRVDGTVVSSTAVRTALEAGDVVLVRRMLDRPYVVSGEVVHGDSRGRTLNCPTANLDLDT